MQSNIHTRPVSPQRFPLKNEASSKVNGRHNSLQQKTNVQDVGKGAHFSNRQKSESLHVNSVPVDCQPAYEHIAERIRRRKQTAKNDNKNSVDNAVFESTLRPSEQDRRKYRRLKRRIKRIREIRLRMLNGNPRRGQNFERLNLALGKLLRKFSRYHKRWNKSKSAGSDRLGGHEKALVTADENAVPASVGREGEATASSFQAGDLKLTASLWDDLSSSSDDEAWDSHMLARENLNLALAIELPTMPSDIQTIPAASPRSLLQLEKGEIEVLEQALRLQQKQQNGLRRRSSWRGSSGTRTNTPILKKVGMKRFNSTGSIRLTSAGLVLTDGKPACVGGGSFSGPDCTKAPGPLSSKAETSVANHGQCNVPDVSQVRASHRAKFDAAQQGGEDDDKDVDEAEILQNAGCFCFFKN